MDNNDQSQLSEVNQHQSVKKSSHRVLFPILATLVLVIGLFGTLLLAQQPQEQRSRAAGESTVTWTSAVNVIVNGSTIKKAGTVNAWDAGARSSGTILSGNGYAQIKLTDTTGKYRMFGLNHNNTTAGYTDIDYALYFRANGELEIYENGTRKLTGKTYVLGDTFTIAVTNKVARYYKNGLLLYTSTQKPVYPLFVDVSFLTAGSQFSSGQLSSTTYLSSSTPQPTSPTATKTTISMGPLKTIATPTLGGFTAIQQDTSGAIWLSFQTTTDSASVFPQFSELYQRPGWVSWAKNAQSVQLGSAVNLDNGDILAISPEWAPQANLQKANISLYTKTLAGGTWTKKNGTINLTSPLRSTTNRVYFNNDIFKMEGNFYAPYYASFAADGTGHRVELASSTDGITWKTYSTIFKPSTIATGRTDFSETAVVYLGNGVLYAAARQQLTTGAYLPLAYATSTDYGKTWSQPRNITFGGKDIEQSVQPRIFPIGTNRYALLTGRLDNYLYIGTKNGNTINWTARSLIFSNYNTKNRIRGSSGYMGGAVISSGSNYANLLLSFDSCAPGWGCQPISGGEYTYSKIYRIMTRTAAVSW